MTLDFERCGPRVAGLWYFDGADPASGPSNSLIMAVVGYWLDGEPLGTSMQMTGTDLPGGERRLMLFAPDSAA